MDNTVIIGVDHGWSQMKTAEAVFSSGVEEILSEPAFFDDVLEYGGKYYKVGTKRDAVMENKTVNDDYYLLTLAYMAKEMKRRSMNEAKVILATGFPVTRYGAEKKEFIEYLSRNKDIRFKFEKEEYRIVLEKIALGYEMNCIELNKELPKGRHECTIKIQCAVEGHVSTVFLIVLIVE